VPIGERAADRAKWNSDSDSKKIYKYFPGLCQGNTGAFVHIHVLGLASRRADIEFRRPAGQQAVKQAYCNVEAHEYIDKINRAA